MKHILIDYENIQPKNFDGIETNSCHIWLFLGVNQQKSLPLELFEALLNFDNKKIHLIKMQHAGKNALDFYLSFYLGKISEIDFNADICILARDSGYDVLVEHLNSAYNGMNIMRLENTTQLMVAYKADEKIESDIEENQLIINDNQEVRGSNIDTTVVDSQISLNQSVEDSVPKAIIHECYIFIFDSIVNRKVFLPNYKSNLLYSMRKYVPVTVLKKFNSAEQDYIIEQVFNKFVKLGLIKIDENAKKLIYKIDSQGVLDLVIDQVLRNKAKEIDGLNNVIKQNLTIYRQENNQEQVDLVVTYLKNKGLIKQNDKAISYPPFDDVKINASKAAHNNDKHNSPATVYQRAIALIKSRSAGTRPSKKSSLLNYLKSHLCNEDPKVIDNIVKQMVNNKVIVISNTNKLSYNL